MSITNYTELKAGVADWLNREDLTAQIPDFITFAEARLNRTLRVREMLTRRRTSTTEWIYWITARLFQKHINYNCQLMRQTRQSL